MLILLASLCTVCNGFFVNVKEILKSQAYHIHVVDETFGLSSCRTNELSDCRAVGLAIGS